MARASAPLTPAEQVKKLRANLQLAYELLPDLPDCAHTRQHLLALYDECITLEARLAAIT
jgi:hypothetical protein